MHRPNHGEGALRRHRFSQTGASFFLTPCTAQRSPGLHTDTLARAIHREIEAMEADRHWRLRGAVVMPDHLHLFVALTNDLPISRCIGRLKAKTKPALALADLAWQPNFYEHRLRPDESAEPVLRYIHLNPYREELIGTDAIWPAFWLGVEERTWFSPLLDDGKPFPEWLR